MTTKLAKHFSQAMVMALFLTTLAVGARKLEWLDRGLTAVKVNNGVFLSWRVLGTDPKGLSFNIYRGATKVNSTPVTGATNLTDASGTLNATYTVRAILNGEELPDDGAVSVLPNFWKSIPLAAPKGGTSPGNSNYTYSPGDASSGDLDGDGKLDIVLKWDPSNAKDNSQAGYTGNVYLDGYAMSNGKRQFRIDLGMNIRAGAHYTQFVVADFDLDGRAEIICKTAPGTKDGSGAYLSKGPAANDDDSKDYRNGSGYILSGPEYLTVFRGVDGKELATVAYSPRRHSTNPDNPTANQMNAEWGDGYGNRLDRFLASAAWLDGEKPSAIMQRGYYTQMNVAAYDWNGSTLSLRWLHHSGTRGQQCYGQGNHNLTVGDVDNDGKDEIIQGACAINDDGKFMYRTGLGHGDAMHLGDLDPNRAGLEVWEIHEDAGSAYGYEMHDARTGEILWGKKTGTDNGRGMAADISATDVGYEMWSSGNNPTSVKGVAIPSATKPSVNFRLYWDGDLQDEMLDGTKLDKWSAGGIARLVTLNNYPSGNGVASNNGTKATPCLSADLFGDWREEIVMRTGRGDSLLIFTTTTPTTHRLYTLMHDPVYRATISWQQAAYNQPPHLGFFLGNGADKAPTPAIELIRYGNSTPASSVSIASSANPISSSALAVSSSAQGPVSIQQFQKPWHSSEQSRFYRLNGRRILE